MAAPQFTVLSSGSPGSPWIGRGWEFFDNRTTAHRRYLELIRQGHVPTCRPYHYLGASHRQKGGQ